MENKVMPIIDCIKNGAKGRKYGKEGKCYIGPKAQEHAIKQTAAVHISRQKRLSKK